MLGLLCYLLLYSVNMIWHGKVSETVNVFKLQHCTHLTYIDSNSFKTQVGLIIFRV